MAILRGPDIVRDGLLLALDAGSPKSYPGSGTTLYDLSGKENHAAFGGATYSSNKYGVLSLDGTDDRVTIQDVNGDFDFGIGDFSICLWIKQSYDTTYPHLFSIDDQSNFSLKAVRPDAASDPRRLYVYQGYSVTFTNSYLTLNEWEMITLTRNDQTHKLYINGAISDTVTDTSGPKNITAGYAYLGWGWGSEYSPQERGPVYVYNFALSDDQVLQNYKAQKFRFE